MDAKLDKSHTARAGAGVPSAATKASELGRPPGAGESSFGSEATTTLMIQAGQMPGEQVSVRGTAQPQRSAWASAWAGFKDRCTALFGGKAAG